MNIREKPFVLAVDDDKGILELLKDSLSEKYRIVPVTNGKDAIDVVSNTGIDLILLDVMMPDMDGREVCQYLKTRRRFSSIPIVMLTAVKTRRDLIQGIESGANAYVTKPFMIDDLAQIIDTQLERAEKLKQKEWVQGWIEFTVKNEEAYLEEVNELVERLHAQSNLDEQMIIDMTIAFREVLTNAYEHGNDMDPDKEIYVSYMLLPDKLLLKIEDMGHGFDVTKVPNPLNGENLFRSRGRGVYITRKLMDEIVFSGARGPLDDDLGRYLPPEETGRDGQIVLMTKYLNK